MSAVVYFYVVNPDDAVNHVLDYYRATVQIAQTTLRNVFGQVELDQVLSEREDNQPQGAGDHRRAHRALGHEGDGRRGERRGAAGLDAARDGTPGGGGAREARPRAAGARRVPSGADPCGRRRADRQEPAALQLRYLQTLIEIGVDKNTTIVFPLPIDLIEPLQTLARRSASATEHGPNGNTPTPMAPPPQPAQVTGPRTTPAELPPAPRAQE